MTGRVRITQADMERVFKSLANAGVDRARVVMDIANSRIEVIIGDAPSSSPAMPEGNAFDRWLASEMRS